MLWKDNLIILQKSTICKSQIMMIILSYDDHQIYNDDRHMCTSGGREEGNSRESISSALSCYSWTHFQNDPHPTQPYVFKKLLWFLSLGLHPF